MENYLNEYIKTSMVNVNEDFRESPNTYVATTIIQVQTFEQPYDEDTAFCEGTIFPSLNKPFKGGGK